MSIKVSVCIPVYGVEKYIEKCARSLFEQTMRDGIEFIFVNDCTKDRSIEILEQVLAEYPHRKEQTRIIHHKKNRGLIAARNTGLAYASGEYIIHCDSDDWVELDMYEKLYNTAQRNNSDISYCSYILDDGENMQKITTIAPCNNPDHLLHLILKNNLHWNLWAKLVKAEIAKSVDLYLPDHISFGEDLLRSTQMISQATSVACCPEPLYHYFKANTGSYTKTFKRTSYDQLAEVVCFLKNYLPEYCDLTVCQAEVLFKGVFYNLLTNQEFKKHSYNWRKKILFDKNLSKIKKMILFCAFCNYPVTAFFCRILRTIKG